MNRRGPQILDSDNTAINMKLYLKTILFALMSVFFSISPALCQQSSPTDPWQKSPQGIEVQLKLNGTALTVNLKNASDSVMKLVGERDHLVRFFYINSEGKRIPLRDKSETDTDSKKQSGSAIIPQNGESPFNLKIELSAEHLNLLKTCPVSCRFVVNNSSTRQYFTIVSDPRLLVDGK